MLRVFVTLAGFLAVAPAITLAHGIGQRIDLPIPLDLYIVGGAAVVALSFLAVWFLPPNFIERLFSKRLFHVRFLDWLVSDASYASLRVLSSVFFLFLLYAGFVGSSNAEQNILSTTVWIIFAVGITFFSALVGNIWRVINPVANTYSVVEKLLSNILPSSTVRVWHVVWGVWPALLGFLLFRWFENVYPAASEPHILVWLVLLYVGYSFAGMYFFGKDTWLRHADPFAVFFSFLSKFSLFTVETHDNRRRVFLRMPASGLLHEQPTFSEILFVLAMLSTVTADGFFETPTMVNLVATLQSLGAAEAVTYTIALPVLLGAFIAIYFGMAALVRALLPNVVSTLRFASLFVLSLLPISVAYEFAHYASLLLLEGQRFFALLSDPLGRGWNIFGTAEWEIHYALINMKVLWNVQIGAIVVGHVIAVLVAHAIAERVFKNRDHVLASQYPMLVVMLFYTMFSLWIIAQPVVA